MQGKKKKKIRFDISVWVAISAIAVLAVILGMMIFMQFQQRKDQAVTLFIGMRMCFIFRSCLWKLLSSWISTTSL
jgi:heme/copper-type cytochrome/quinol oxidase subunit 4